MLTNFSKWLIYVASYFPVYAILIIRLLFSTQPDSEALSQRILLNLCQYFYILIALAILFLLSIPALGKIKRLQANERIYSKLEKNCTGEMASFFIPFILSVLTIGIDWYGWILFLFIFVICGFVVIQADWVRLCPAFFYLKYRLYSTNNGCFVLSRLSIEQVNQILFDDTNGLEVKALTPKLYITVRNSF